MRTKYDVRINASVSRLGSMFLNPLNANQSCQNGYDRLSGCNAINEHDSVSEHGNEYTICVLKTALGTANTLNPNNESALAVKHGQNAV